MSTSLHTGAAARARLARRHASERRFRLYGAAAIVLGLLFVAVLFVDIVGKGWSAFWQTEMLISVTLDRETLGVGATPGRKELATANYAGVVRDGIRAMFPEVKGRADRRKLAALVSSGAGYLLRERVLSDPGLIGQSLELWVPADDDLDMLVKGHSDRTLPEAERRLDDDQLAWVERLEAEGRIEKRFNKTFFTAGDSREPELAGIRGAAMGSFYTLLVTLALSFPIGVAAALYQVGS